MKTMTTRVIAQKSKRLNKDILKYIRRHKIKHTKTTYTTKNNRKATEYILNIDDAERIIKRFNKDYKSINVNVSLDKNNVVTSKKTKKIITTKKNSVQVTNDKKDTYLNIYSKYAINSKTIRKVVLSHIFSPMKKMDMSIDESFELIVDTINAFNLHDYISNYAYNLGSHKSYKFFLKSTYWNVIRMKQLQDHPICAICGATENLRVHHPDYKQVPRGTEYKNMHLLTTVCDECHSNIHNK